MENKNQTIGNDEAVTSQETESVKTIKTICPGCGKEFDAAIRTIIRLDTKKPETSVDVVCSGKCACKVLGVKHHSEVNN